MKVPCAFTLPNLLKTILTAKYEQSFAFDYFQPMPL